MIPFLVAPRVSALAGCDSGPPESVADEAIHKERGDSLGRATTTAAILDAEQYSGNNNKTQPKATSNESNSQGNSSGVNAPGSDENTIELKEFMELYTKLSKKVLDLESELEKTKSSHKLKVESLERRVKKLERRNKSRTNKLKRLYKIGLTARVDTSDDEEPAVDEEDTSKQGRIIEEIDINDDIIIVSDEV
ncbi:hypothetical protein Tco_1485230 [Tanacetum coccineum]